MPSISLPGKPPSHNVETSVAFDHTEAYLGLSFLEPFSHRGAEGLDILDPCWACYSVAQSYADTHVGIVSASQHQ